MEPAEIKIKYPMRDPHGNAERYNSLFSTHCNWLNDSPHELFNTEFFDWDEDRRICYEGSVVSDVLKRASYMYSRGDLIPDLILRIQDDIPFIESRTLSRRQRWAEHKGQQIDLEIGYIYYYDRYQGFNYMAIALMLLSDLSFIKILAGVLNTDQSYRLYLFDILFKAFLPDWKPAPKYDRKSSHIKRELSWSDPILRVLAQPPEQRAEALTRHMKNWCRIMKPFGWKPVRDYSPEADARRGNNYESLFVDFAFEVALVVCAYDIDDSDFCDHPYYPRDLVEHYRTHIRHTRDAWRAMGVGAGIAVELPPLPKPIDLAKSKSKGITRWVELASQGDLDAIEAVIDQVGKPRKVQDLSELTAALAENDAGIHADIKDDESLYSQLDTLYQRRQLGEFTPPDLVEASAGPDRCAHLLQVASQWLPGRGYQLVQLDGDDDAWHAALVSNEYHTEFLGLCKQLGIVVH
jgi:Domain of unknown function (DUF1911)